MEKKLNKSLMRNRVKDKSLTEAQHQYENIKELVSKSIHEEFYKVIEDEKEKYTQNLNELRNSKNVFRKKLKHNKPSISASNKESIISTKPEEQEEMIDVNMKIGFLETLDDDFRFQTEEENMNTLLLYLKEGEELNEKLYTEFTELENQLEELNQDYKTNIRFETKRETQSVSTKANTNREVTEMDDVVEEENLHQQFEDSTVELDKLIVS